MGHIPSSGTGVTRRQLHAIKSRIVWESDEAGKWAIDIRGGRRVGGRGGAGAAGSRHWRCDGVRLSRLTICTPEQMLEAYDDS